MRRYSITIEKDGEGFLAKVNGENHLFAFGYSQKEALLELNGVITATLDVELERIEHVRHARLVTQKRMKELGIAVPV